MTIKAKRGEEMKKVLCVKDLNSRHDGGLMAKAGKLYEVDDYATFKSEKGTNVHICIWPYYLKEVETFEHDGEEWIKHGSGGCPVPDFYCHYLWLEEPGFEIKLVGRWSSIKAKYVSGWLSGMIKAYRVISTAEEKPAPKAESTCQSDERPPSPQELAFAAKHPEPEKPKPLAFPDVKLNDNFSCHVGGKWG